MPNKFDKEMIRKAGPLGAFRNISPVPPQAYIETPEGFQLDLEQENNRAAARKQPAKYRQVPYRSADPVLFDVPVDSNGRRVMYPSDWENAHYQMRVPVDPLASRAYVASLPVDERAAIRAEIPVPKSHLANAGYRSWANKLGNFSKMGVMGMFSPAGMLEQNLLERMGINISEDPNANPYET